MIAEHAKEITISMIQHSSIFVNGDNNIEKAKNIASFYNTLVNEGNSIFNLDKNAYSQLEEDPLI